MATTNETKAPEITPEMQAVIDKQVAEAKAKLEADMAAKEAEAKAKLEADMAKAGDADDLVEVTLFKDSGKYKDDVFVSVNGETCLIKRGVAVKVKRKFADVLALSQEQDRKAAKLITDRESDFFAEAAQHGVN